MRWMRVMLGQLFMLRRMRFKLYVRYVCVCVCVFLLKRGICWGLNLFNKAPEKKVHVHMGSVLYSVQYIQHDITTIHMRTY